MAEVELSPSALDTLPGKPAAGLPQEGRELSSDIFNGMFSGGGPDNEDGGTPAQQPASLSPAPNIELDPFADFNPTPSSEAPPGSTGLPGITPAPSAPGAPVSPIDPIQLAMEHERLKNYAQTLAPMAPILQFLQAERPDILETIQQAIVAKNSPTQTLEAPKPPEAPVRPAGYNPTEAYSVPDSESFKYREAVEKYNSDRVEFLQKQIEHRDKVQQVQAQRQAEVDKRQLLVRQSFQDAISQGATPEQAADYVKVLSHPLSLSPKNLWQYYLLLRKAAPQAPARREPPLPGGGFQLPAGQVDAAQAGFSGMLQSWKKPQR